jgi:hypothetical protein
MHVLTNCAEILPVHGEEVNLLLGLDSILSHQLSPLDDVCCNLGGKGLWRATDGFRALLGKEFLRGWVACD